ncbi:MAG TPA: flagellar biosynthetic protein FliO [Bryobacteraceae bacterium]|nr:flagellar biosynthetic protein FliO [Bryobacteraceae bacterium]
MIDTLQPLAAVVAVLALLGGVLFVLRRRFPKLSPGDVGSMELVERLPLGPQHALHLVRVGERRIVVATAPSSCQFLGEVEQ